MKVLVTGAAGFIGSVVAEQFVAEGHQVVGLDSLKYGRREAVDPAVEFIAGDLLDPAAVARAVDGVEAVAHLAAEAFIDDSLRDPGLFYRANVVGGLNLIEAMAAAGVKKLVFSSTAAVYGEPQTDLVSEEAPLTPCNAYGESKLAFERMLPWYAAAYGLGTVALRYFNACGATERCGEARRRETHLIPICLAAALGERDGLQLFGTDYPTPDGTCVRDYVHVADIARAHSLALASLSGPGLRAYNLGNSRGYSNREVIATVQQVTGRPFPVTDAARRPGDPPVLVADASRAQAELGWTPSYPSLESMVTSAWNWRQRRSGGAGS